MTLRDFLYVSAPWQEKRLFFVDLSGSKPSPAVYVGCFYDSYPEEEYLERCVGHFQIDTDFTTNEPYLSIYVYKSCIEGLKSADN